ncbi:hypothetical protein Dimus_013588 [Dionaea muscipula]
MFPAVRSTTVAESTLSFLHQTAVSASAASSSLFLPSNLILRRTFVDAKVRWARDRYLDAVVEREKDLKPSLSLKHLILSSPSLSLSLSVASLHKLRLNLPTTALKFFQFYPSLFKIFLPSSDSGVSRPYVKLTPDFLSLYEDEREIHESSAERELAAIRLAKLLMLTRSCRIPLSIIHELKFDLGFPDNYILDLVSYFPDYFRICENVYCDSRANDDDQNGRDGGGLVSERFGLELVSWRKEWAVSAIERKVLGDACGEKKRGVPIKFPLLFTPGYDLQKKVKNWTEEWQCLPYISPYEDAFHLAPSSDQAEKWTVAVIHELLSLLVSKKTEMRTIFKLGDYWGFGRRFKKALVHHPGIFYVSNKIRTQTVVLREAYRKDFLLEKHPLMGMRHRYIYLMSKSNKRTMVVKRLIAKKRSMWCAKGMKGEVGTSIEA